MKTISVVYTLDNGREITLRIEDGRIGTKPPIGVWTILDDDPWVEEALNLLTRLPEYDMIRKEEIALIETFYAMDIPEFLPEFDTIGEFDAIWCK
jgi:hypothetical protein